MRPGGGEFFWRAVVAAHPPSLAKRFWSRKARFAFATHVQSFIFFNFFFHFITRKEAALYLLIVRDARSILSVADFKLIFFLVANCYRNC